MRIAVLGGDGFCGWPSALHLSAAGHDVTITDNLVRRRMDVELGVQSLTPIRSPHDRIEAWRETTGHAIELVEFDLAREYDRLVDFLSQQRPDAVVHSAEQRAAPYSMKSPAHKRYTVDNNVNATHNLLAALVDVGRDAHVVHLGTMGVYGYETAPVDLPEGYLTITYPDREPGAVGVRRPRRDPVRPHRRPQRRLVLAAGARVVRRERRARPRVGADRLLHHATAVVTDGDPTA